MLLFIDKFPSKSCFLELNSKDLIIIQLSGSSPFEGDRFVSILGFACLALSS